MFYNTIVFIGIGLGDKFSEFFILDQDANVIEESRIHTTINAFQSKFSILQPCRITMEVGSHSRWASQALKEAGPEVIVADARKLRLIYENPRKGDRADAEYLARLARLDPNLLSPVYHRGMQTQAHLSVLRSRDILVRA